MTLYPILTMTIALPATIPVKAKRQIASVQNAAILTVVSIDLNHERHRRMSLLR